MSAVGAIHLALALVALGSGLVVVLGDKGTAAHQRAGWFYVSAMAGVNVTALLIYRLLGSFGPFHWAALFSLMTVLAGILPTRLRTNRYWLRQHAYWMCGSYVGLCAAAVAETVTRLRLLPFWWMVAASTAVVMALGAAIIARRVPMAIQSLARRNVNAF